MAEPSSLNARFVTGSTMRHILVMTSTSTLGLMAIFLVDLVDMYFLSLLGEQAIAAAVGFAGTIAFFTTSISIAMTIAAGVIISKALGRGEQQRARTSTVNISVFSFCIAVVVAVSVWLSIEPLLSLLGASGQTHQYATDYLEILLPSMPILALGMTASGALRAIGDAKRAMYCTLAGGAVNALLDPVFIFYFGWGVEGAAIASVFARITVFLVAVRGVVVVHQLYAKFSFSLFINDLKPIVAIAIPALLTNLATPVGSAFVTRMISGFGDSYVAGYAVVGRVIPVAFAMIFALSGAIGPVVGQNFGAGNLSRVRQAQTDALIFGISYTLMACLITWLASPALVQIFNLDMQAAEIFVFYWSFIGVSFVFLGSQYVSNATFNNLGKPIWSTCSNWGRVLLGTFPLTWLGAHYYGVFGVLVGEAIGVTLIGITALLISRRLIKRLEQDKKVNGSDYCGENATAAVAPYSSGTAMTTVVASRQKHK